MSWVKRSCKLQENKIWVAFLTNLAPVTGFSRESLHRLWVTISGFPSHIELNCSPLASVLPLFITWEYVGDPELELAENDFARLFWLAKTMLKEANLIQIWFSQLP